jgi:hypothetical protein
MAPFSTKHEWVKEQFQTLDQFNKIMGSTQWFIQLHALQGMDEYQFTR